VTFSIDLDWSPTLEFSEMFPTHCWWQIEQVSHWLWGSAGMKTAFQQVIFTHKVGYGDLYSVVRLQGSLVGLFIQDYESLCEAVSIYGTLFNMQTDTQNDSVWPSCMKLNCSANCVMQFQGSQRKGKGQRCCKECPKGNIFNTSSCRNFWTLVHLCQEYVLLFVKWTLRKFWGGIDPSTRSIWLFSDL